MTLFWLRPALPLAVIPLLACTPAPPEVSSSGETSSSDASSTGPGPTTMPTTTPNEDTTVGTQGVTGTDTTMGVVDSTLSSSTGTDETTMGVVSATSSTSSGGESSSTGDPPPQCLVPTDCANNETCDLMGQCAPLCDPWGDGTGDYGYCLTEIGGFNSTVLCGEPMSCLNSGNPIEVVVCGVDCVTTCDCPPPEATGDATVTCGDLTGEGNEECYLSCANGETCPTGMTCRADFMGNPLYCAHPVQPLPMFGNCGGIAAPCVDSFCQIEGAVSICLDTCANVGDCAAAPDGAANASACGAVIFPPMGNECYLPCVGDGDCPSGMTCYTSGAGGQLCMWP